MRDIKLVKGVRREFKKKMPPLLVSLAWGITYASTHYSLRPIRELRRWRDSFPSHFFFSLLALLVSVTFVGKKLHHSLYSRTPRFGEIAVVPVENSVEKWKRGVNWTEVPMFRFSEASGVCLRVCNTQSCTCLRKGLESSFLIFVSEHLAVQLFVWVSDRWLGLTWRREGCSSDETRTSFEWASESTRSVIFLFRRLRAHRGTRVCQEFRTSYLGFVFFFRLRSPCVVPENFVNEWVT